MLLDNRMTFCVKPADLLAPANPKYVPDVSEGADHNCDGSSTFHFVTSKDPKVAIENWRELSLKLKMVNSHFSFETLPGSKVPKYKAEGMGFGSTQLSYSEHTGISFDWESDNARELEEDMVGFGFAISANGKNTMSIDGQDYTPGLNDCWMVQLSNCDHSGKSECLQMGIYVIPRKELGTASQPIHSSGRLLQNSPVANLLRIATFDLRNALREAENDTAETLDNCIRGIVASVARDKLSILGSRSIQSARRSAAQNFIENSLHDPAIDADVIAHHVGSSRATLYRDFKNIGGVRTAILEARLKAANEALRSTTQFRGRVSEIAYRFGFTSPFQFSRAFRNKYGSAPSDVYAVVPKYRNAKMNDD